MKRVAKIAAAASTILTSLSLLASKVSAQYEWDYSYTTDIADTGTWAAFTGLGLLCQIPICIIGVAGFAFTIWMIIDAVQRDDKVLPGKIKWIILMILTGGIGSLIYFFTRKKKLDAMGQ